MSDSQTAWSVLWNRASQGANPREPFEISEVAPELAGTLNVSEKDAARLIGLLLGELGRLPQGKRFFRLEGNAVAPLPEFAKALHDKVPPLQAYPYEL